ncbi:ribonuclease III [Thiohalophilus thiocyanatoxydans]|uniref:Ribonuclease 3 n=1 Tax=Thiohalophilus thiocyanatoxydans TaxID=381308 RepID=A0A4R8IZT0_9GAMM|nr:ribonuclease III [Thiohalophilus thiocyanatoxydans]TDY02983.1 RNAse III [Thiohalophilus thiocyanatoxydans]
MRNPEKLCRQLGYEFKQPELLDIALTHRSYGSRNNERMEFLGDAVLGYLVSAELYRRFPQASEGALSRLRASLVKGETLASIATELELGDYMSLGSGELKSGGHRRRSILADAFEAIIGAVYLDSGMDNASRLVQRFFDDRFSRVDPDTLEKDPKTRLQEYLQARGNELPDYQVVATEGKAHEQRFRVECKIGTFDATVVGEGTSRRKAEQAAAEKMLQALTN